MKKLLFFTIVLITALGFTIFNLYSYYAPPLEHQPYIIKQKSDDTLHIAYIGDSWAFMHKNHNCQISKIIGDSLQIPVVVHSFGICGITSKEFYESIFYNSSLTQFLQKRNYSCCFISLGINDTYKKMSTDYYKYSMNYIIKFLLANNIHPIIMEIPDYDIIKAYNRQVLSRKILRQLSMLVNDIPLNCKQLYRNSLDDIITENNYTNLLSVIRYKIWNNNRTKDFNTIYLNDGMHLNEKGYSKLDSCISETYIRHCNSKNRRSTIFYENIVK